MVLILLCRFMSEKDKNRLYITLQYRSGKPRFHWALLLAPKSESTDVQIKDSHLFHVTNSIQPGIKFGANGKPEWRYEDEPVNSMARSKLIGRVLVAKLPTNESLSAERPN